MMMGTPSVSDVDIHLNDGLLTLAWEDGERKSFHSIWLRDNCQCAKCRHPNGQKLTNIDKLSLDTKIVSVEREKNNLRIQFYPDNHSAQISLAWLHNFPTNDDCPQQILWDSESLAVADVARSYHDINDATIAEWLEFVVLYGFAVLRDVPCEQEMVCNIVKWFGFVRETNYGRLFEVKSTGNPNNLAYTNMALSVHTDNPYRDPPPGLQLLHCLKNTTTGGDSVVVDGFMAANILAEENDEHYHLLCRYAVPFHFCDSTANLRSRLPILDIAADGEMRAINFNNRSIAAVDIPITEQPKYYAAYRHFFEILQRPKINLQFKTKSGDLFIVDNRRVLHGRSGFKSSGGRHLQGCYADKDALLSTWRMARGNKNK